MKKSRSSSSISGAKRPHSSSDLNEEELNTTESFECNPIRTLTIFGPRKLTEKGFTIIHLPRWSYRIEHIPEDLNSIPTALYARTNSPEYEIYELQYARASFIRRLPNPERRWFGST